MSKAATLDSKRRVASASAVRSVSGEFVIGRVSWAAGGDGARDGDGSGASASLPDHAGHALDECRELRWDEGLRKERVRTGRLSSNALEREDARAQDRDDR